MKYPRLFGPDTELGRWLGTRNTMQMIGNDLYVHAGLGKDFYDKNLSIPTVNEEMSKGLFMTKKNAKRFLHSQPSCMETAVPSGIADWYALMANTIRWQKTP